MLRDARMAASTGRTAALGRHVQWPQRAVLDDATAAFAAAENVHSLHLRERHLSLTKAAIKGADALTLLLRLPPRAAMRRNRHLQGRDHHVPCCRTASGKFR